MSYLKKNLGKRLAKLTDSVKIGPRPIIMMGDEEASKLEQPAFGCTAVTNKIKNEIKILKATACAVGACSLSSTQIGLRDGFFIIARKLNAGQWLNYKNMDPEHYNVYLNPKITYGSKVNM